jgi:hypothetical protein
MSDTFRIKPLVWEQDDRCASVPFNGVLDIYATRRERLTRSGKVVAVCWVWYIESGWGAPPREGECESLESAKLAAESAYRDLLMAALEPV